MKRLGTREAIRHAVQYMDALVKTSGAVSFTDEAVPHRQGLYSLKVYSYSMCIAEFWYGFEPQAAGEHSDRHSIMVKRKPITIFVNREKRSTTTSKHQSWLYGSINTFCPNTLLVESSGDQSQDMVAADKAVDHGWLGIDAATLTRVQTYGERDAD